MKKTNFFYFDETGHINNDSVLFIYGCIKTDTPKLIEETLNRLKQELTEDVLLREFGERILKNNFHATGDPIEVRTDMFRLLPYLNFRAYFTVLFKDGNYYKKLKTEKKDHEIIELMLRKIVIPRITKNKTDINRFYFERLDVQKKSLRKIIDDIFVPYSKDITKPEIVNKDDPNIPVIDYISFILQQILTPDKDGKIPNWASRAFEAIKDKIALVHFQNDDSYYSRLSDKEHQIEFENLINKWQVTKDK